GAGRPGLRRGRPLRPAGRGRYTRIPGGGARLRHRGARPGGDATVRRGGCPGRPGPHDVHIGWSAMSAPLPEYSSVTEVRGPLLVVQGVAGVGWDEFARIRLPGGEIRHGLVLEVDRD